MLLFGTAVSYLTTLRQTIDRRASTLPIVTFALKYTDHLSLGTSPFFALYGRHPISLLELEKLHLLAVAETGHEFVKSLASRLGQAWSVVRNISISVRAAV
eukprot:3691766-Pleurochrysis_carterae.AAC.1